MTERVATLERELEALQRDLIRFRQHSTANSFPSRPAITIAPSGGSYPTSGTVVPIVFLDADFPDSTPSSATWTQRQRGTQRFYATSLDDSIPDVNTRVQVFNWRGRWYIASAGEGETLPDVAMVKVLDTDPANAIDTNCCMYPGAIRSRIPGAPRTSGTDQDCDPTNPCANSGYEKITKVWVQPHCPGAVIPDCVLAKRVSDEYDCKGTAQPVYKQMSCDECCPVWTNSSGDPVGTRINAHVKFGDCQEHFFHICFHECVVRYTPEGLDATGPSSIVNVTGPITSLAAPNNPIGAWFGTFTCTFQSPKRVVEFTIDQDPALGPSAPDTVYVEVQNGCSVTPTEGVLYWINPATDDFETYGGTTVNANPTGNVFVLTQGASRTLQWEECQAEWYLVFRCLDDTPSGIRFVDVSLFLKHPDASRTQITDQDIIDGLGAEIECPAAEYERIRYVGDTTIANVNPVQCANTVSGSVPGLSFPFGNAYTTTVTLLGHVVAWNPLEFHSPCGCQGVFFDENLTFPYTTTDAGGTVLAGGNRLQWQNSPLEVNLSW